MTLAPGPNPRATSVTLWHLWFPAAASTLSTGQQHTSLHTLVSCEATLYCNLPAKSLQRFSRQFIPAPF